MDGWTSGWVDGRRVPLTAKAHHALALGGDKPQEEHVPTAAVVALQHRVAQRAAREGRVGCTGARADKNDMRGYQRSFDFLIPM